RFAIGILVVVQTLAVAIGEAKSAEPLPFVKVAQDNSGFIAGDTGQKLFPWGFNYDHDEDGRLIEDYWEKEWPKVEADFGEMKELGANVVRIHIQFARLMEAADKQNQNT